MEVQPGQIWKPKLGGPALYIVALEDRVAHVVRADAPKKHRDKRGVIVALSEMEDWTMLEDAATKREP